MQKRVLHVTLTILVFIYIVFEELVWESIAKPIYDYIHSLKILKKVELKLKQLPASLLLLTFLSIFIAVESVGLLAGVMLVKGHVYSAVTLYSAKIPIAAFAFWMFRVTKTKLMTISWFAKSYHFSMAQIEKIKQCETYKEIKAKTHMLKQKATQLKAKYLPKGELKRRAKRIYVQLKKIFRKDIS